MNWRTVAIGVLAAIGPVVAGPLHAKDKPTQDTVKDSRQAWKKALAESVKVGSTTAVVEKFMAAKFRDKAKLNWGGSGSYSVFYLIDDFSQIEFAFDVRDKLESEPTITDRGLWLRGPDGALRQSPRSEEKK
jgi:hypothetical protein